MLIHIKNMVCDRCMMVVRQQLEHLGFRVDHITLGSADIFPAPTDAQKTAIASSLKVLGFELIDHDKDQVVERIKNIVIELIHHSLGTGLPVSFPEVLSDRLNRDYTWLSRLFSERHEHTLEKFIIHQKIERVKELLEYGDLTLNEIAYRMGYSSGSHLSNQFKQVTGMSAKAWKSQKEPRRKPIDRI